ncbi:DUF998 domain-containing protein [Tabrizicola sp.]|uniref:DUF998 domain-containing protein n=1 Tax=Tabrizicola sp. TaxID=2005166 RepID=UPI001A56306D|nr:DUF998 domain-containing protein [Tabrizicola sp.]MBL9075843.1 DUF998 domain-containing protein [Tabrizicola sp.]
MERVAAALYGLDLLFLLSFQVMNRDQPAFSRPISDYGLGRTARLFRVYLIAGCIAPPILAWQVHASGDPDFPASVPVYLGLVALGRLGIALWQSDPQDMPHSRHGTLHRAATLLAFTSAYMAVVEATPHLVALHEGWRSVADEVLKQVISIGFLAVVLTIASSFRPWFGLAERAFLYATALWFLLATLTLPPL